MDVRKSKMQCQNYIDSFSKAKTIMFHHWGEFILMKMFSFRLPNKFQSSKVNPKSNLPVQLHWTVHVQSSSIIQKNTTFRTKLNISKWNQSEKINISLPKAELFRWNYWPKLVRFSNCPIPSYKKDPKSSYLRLPQNYVNKQLFTFYSVEL